MPLQTVSVRSITTAGLPSATARRTTPLRGDVISMKLNVERWDAAKQGKLSDSAILNKLQAEGYSTTVYTFSSGTKFPFHTQWVHKKDAILSGRFLFRTEDDEVVLEAGDAVEVPHGLRHYAEVIGQQPVTFVDATKY